MCRGDRDNGSESARCGGDNRSQPQEHGVTARSVRPPKAAVRVCHGQLPVSCPAGEGEVGWLLVPGRATGRDGRLWRTTRRGPAWPTDGLASDAVDRKKLVAWEWCIQMCVRGGALNQC